jgi:hypothetical protein
MLLLFKSGKIRKIQRKLAEARLALATCIEDAANKLSAARELAELALETQEKLFGKGSKKNKLALMLLSSIYISSNSNHFDEERSSAVRKTFRPTSQNR